MDRQAVGLLAAVAAALADSLIDHDLLGGRRVRAALAVPALLGRAVLIVDQHGHAGDRGQLLLDLQRLGAVADLNATRQSLGLGFLDVIGGDDDLGDLLRLQQTQDLGQAHLADRVLAAGHGDGAVVEQLVGDVVSRGHGSAQGQGARVHEGAVADVLHHVTLVEEGGHPGPLDALAAHLGDAGDVADLLLIHHQHHGVAADAASDERAVRDLGRRVVRTAGAEVRGPGGGQRQGDAAPGAARAVEPGLRRGDGMDLAESLGQAAGHGVHVELTEAAEQRRAVFMGLADHIGHVGAPEVDLADHRLDEVALLLDHDHLVETGHELVQDRALERVDHAELEDPDPAAGQLVVVQSEAPQRLAHIQVGLARGDDPDTVVGGALDDPVDPVEPCVLQGAGDTDGQLVLLELHQARSQQLPRRHVGARAQIAVHGQDPVRVDDRRGGGVGHVRGDLHGR